MPRIVDKEAEWLTMGEIKKLHEVRRKLEEDLRTMDALSSRRMEMGALQDIDAYRTLHRIPALAL